MSPKPDEVCRTDRNIRETDWKQLWSFFKGMSCGGKDTELKMLRMAV